MTSEENEILCRIEGAAPMGQLMRRHWIPACLSEEIQEPDGAPVPVRLFGEDLVAWRASDGRIGLMDRHCPHRRSSLVLGRNEDGGLRCLYHGWKIDVVGNITEMPSELPESGFQDKVKHTPYPVQEHCGMVWTYMGPRESMPPFEAPAYAPSPQARLSIVKIQIDCNWAQVLEGNVDSAHSSSLHSSDIVASPTVGAGQQVTSASYARPSTDRAPRIEAELTAYGLKYAAIRRPIKNAETHNYVRMSIYVAPFAVLTPPTNLYNDANVIVPIDDNHSTFYLIAWSESPNGLMNQDAWRKRWSAQVGIDVDKHYRKVRTIENNYLQDRAAMRMGNFTGISGVPNQDIAMVETMGPIVDRTRERLGSSDRAIVKFRRMMIDAAKEFREGKPAIGTREYAVALGRSYLPQAQIRAFESVMPKELDWRNLDTVEGQKARPAG